MHWGTTRRGWRSLILALWGLGSASRLAASPPQLTVAADGSGSYKTVQAAIDAAPAGSPAQPTVIHIRPGVYSEHISVPRGKRWLRLAGDEAAKTTLTYHLSAHLAGPDGKPLGTFRSASVTVDADGFSAEGLTFENSAGPGRDVGQALAIAVDADRCTFRRCRFLGHQDTLYAGQGRQYYQDCLVAGDVDYIFGNASAVFEDCEIQSLGPGYVTAQARTDPAQTTGYVFQHCTLTGAPGVSPGTVYLGRPWRPYARVVYLDCTLGAHIRPVGWNDWRDPTRQKTAYYAELDSRGPGAGPAARAAWSHQLTAAEAQPFLPDVFLSGADGWNPASAALSPDDGRNKV